MLKRRLRRRPVVVSALVPHHRLCFFFDPVLEQFAAVFVIPEKIETRAGRRQQHRIAGTRRGLRGRHGRFERIGRDHLRDHARELPDQFGVIETHAHQRVQGFVSFYQGSRKWL